jgi:hypothetical protein
MNVFKTNLYERGEDKEARESLDQSPEQIASAQFSRLGPHRYHSSTCYVVVAGTYAMLEWIEGVFGMATWV